MKNSIISLFFLIAYVKGNIDRVCWSLFSKSGKYPCCPDGTAISYSDDEGDWGLVKNKWCGIRKNDKICWSESMNYPCC